ncbi:MAG: TRAP transporter small permease subunit [Pseudomonadota bacterium]
MRALIAYIRAVDRLNEAVGRVVAWLALGTVVVCFLTVYLRYVVGFGFIWLQELYVWQYAIVFMVGAGYTFLYGGHVRVDIFYAPMSVRNKAWVDLIGTVVFALPFMTVVFVESWPFFVASLAIGEGSQQPAGLPALYLLKSTLLLFALLVGLQALAMMARSALVLSGREEFATRAAGH